MSLDFTPSPSKARIDEPFKTDTSIAKMLQPFFVFLFCSKASVLTPISLRQSVSNSLRVTPRLASRSKCLRRPQPLPQPPPLRSHSHISCTLSPDVSTLNILLQFYYLNSNNNHHPFPHLEHDHSFSSTTFLTFTLINSKNYKIDCKN